MKPPCLALGLSLCLAAGLRGAPVDFGAYYTELHSGRDWEAFSRSGNDADIVVRLAAAGGQLVFWRGNSYLPYWKSAKGQWDLEEIIPRSGDGVKPMPDKVNAYAHAEVIENTPSRVVVHWRYLASFTAGNPHGNVSSNHFVVVSSNYFRILTLNGFNPLVAMELRMNLQYIIVECFFIFTVRSSVG